MLNPYKRKCSCGSKKRYIDCCFITPKAWKKVLERQKTATSLRWKVIDYATSTLSEETEEALSVYFQKSVITPAEIPDEQMGAFLDWYIHDYRLPDSDMSVLELFFEERSQLKDIERFLTAGWLPSYNNCYQVVDLKPNYWLIVRDIVTGEDFLVANPELSEMTPPYSIFLGRLQPLGEVFEFDFIHQTLPPTASELIKNLLTSTYNDRSAEHHDLSYRNYLERFLSPILPRLVANYVDANSLSPSAALHDDLKPYQNLFSWICATFYNEDITKKPNGLAKMLQHIKDGSELNQLFDSWPGQLNLTKDELLKNLSWLEFIDACLVLHYGKQPAYDFAKKANLLGLKQTSLPTLKPLSVSRTRINEESQALETISSLLHTHMKSRYPEKQIETAILIWQHYLGQVNDLPDLRKPTTWAGAVEYCLSRILSLPFTQREIANEYAVSSASISRLAKIIASKIDLATIAKSSYPI